MKDKAIKVLQDTIAKIESGDINSVALAYVDKSTSQCCRHIMSCEENTDVFRLLGAVNMMQFYISKHIGDCDERNHEENQKKSVKELF